MSNESAAVPSTQVRKTKCVIQATATPYMIVLDIPKEDVQPRLDKAWAGIAPRIPTSVQAGFRPGSEAFRAHWETKQGLFALYSHEWIEAIYEGAATQSKFVLDVIQCGVMRTELGYRLSAEMYLTPKVSFSGDVPEKVEVEVYSLHPDFIAKQVEHHLGAIREQYELTESIDKPITDGMKVKVSIVAKLDGKPWAAGTTTQELKVGPQSVFPEEMYKALLGKNIGDEFEVVCESLPNIYGPDAKKKLEASVKVIGIQAVVQETMEQLVERAGLGKLEEVKAQFEAKIKESMLKQREENKWDLALHKLRGQSTMGPVPRKWLKSQAEAEYTALLARFKGKTEQEVLAAHGAQSKLQVLQTFTAQISDNLRDELTALAFYDAHGKVDYTRGLNASLKDAREYLKSCIVMSEVDPVSVRKAEGKTKA